MARHRFPKRLSSFSGSQRREVEGYVAALASALRVSDWELDVRWDEPASEDCDAEISVSQGRRSAALYLADGFGRLSADEQRVVLCHELMHIHLQQVEVASRLLIAGTPRRSRKFLTARMEMDLEHTVDTLALAVAPALPAPPWAS